MILLVAEDEALIALVLELELRGAGHRGARPGGHAGGGARARRGNPARAGADRHQPEAGGDGVALARTLRDRHGVPSLFVSGQAPDALAAKDAALGLVRKPYAPEDVARAVEVVAELLRGRRPARLPPGLELFGGTEP